MENATVSLCSTWAEQHPGQERYDWCIKFITEVFLILGAVQMESMRDILISMSRFVEFCDMMSLNEAFNDSSSNSLNNVLNETSVKILNNTLPKYDECNHIHGEAFGYCNMVFKGENASGFWSCFGMVKESAVENPGVVLTKWTFMKLLCRDEYISDFCDEYFFTLKYVFSAETQYLNNPWKLINYRYLLPITGCMSVLLNGFVLFVLAANMSTNFNIFFLRMKSLFDAMAILVQLPVALYASFYQGDGDFIPYSICVLMNLSTYILPSLFHTMSMFTMLGIACQKFVIISYPLKLNTYLKLKYARLYMVLCCSVITLVHFPGFLLVCNMAAVELQSKYDDMIFITTMFPFPAPESSQWVQLIYKFGYQTRTVIIQFLPLFALSLIELSSISKYLRYIRNTKNIRRSSPSSGSLMQVVQTSLANTCIFIIAELPNTIFLAHYCFGDNLDLGQDVINDLVAMVLNNVTSLSALCNLFVCLLFCHNFRTACLELTRCSKQR